MDISLYSISLLMICLFLSAFFSSLETAISSIKESKLKKLMEEKPYLAFPLSLWLRSPNMVLTAILVGNNIVNTLAAACATLIAQKIFMNYAVSAATFSVTLTLLIFCEITPKTFARHNAELLAPIGMTLFFPIYIILWPATYILSGISTRMLKLFGGKSSSEGPLATEEEIEYMIRLGREEGVLRRQDGHLLQSVLEFKQTVAKESMVPRTQIGSFEVNTSYEEVLSRVIEEGHTRWPVYENNIDNIIGIFHAKDLLGHIKNDKQSRKDFSLKSFLRSAKFVPDMMKIGALLKEFQAGKAHLAIVVDEYGGTAGIISLEDVLEEIVGEIRDEYDDEESEITIKQISPNNYVADGRANIFDLGKLLNINFPDTDAFDSLGGFLLSHHGRMPNIGDKITFNDYDFLIKAADEKKIIKVQISKQKQLAIASKDKNSRVEEAAAA